MNRKLAQLCHKKLLAYSLSAVCFFIKNEKATAQVIYTDIDPDIVYDEGPEGGGLDMDANGTIDFAFLNSSFTFFDESSFTYQTRQDILVGPYISQNAIAGVSNYRSFAYSAFIRYYPFAIENGKIINESLHWQTDGFQLLALRTFSEGGTGVGNGFSCFWYNVPELPETLDHYLGVRFLMDDAKIHYGWIRCDVKDEGRTLIIKDYAYEYQAKKSIVAGNIISDIETQQNTLDASVYSFAKTIYVHCALFNNAQLSIRTVAGNEVVNQQLTQASLAINMGAYASGIYSVTIAQNGKFYRTKVITH